MKTNTEIKELNQHQMLKLIPFLENLCKRKVKLLSKRDWIEPDLSRKDFDPRSGRIRAPWEIDKRRQKCF